MNTLSKTILAALCCTMALGTQAQERTFQRNKVLIEKHTGQGCQNCPSAETILTRYLNNTNNTGNVVIMRHHSFNSSNPLYMQFARNLTNTWGITAWPKLQVDRYSYIQDKSERISHSFDASSVNSFDAVTKRMLEPTYVSLSFDGSSFDPATKKLRVVISGEVTKALPHLRVHAFITQSNIISWQSTTSGYSTEYKHDDTSRAYLMDNIDGDILTPADDGTYSKTYETTIPADYGNIATAVENMKVVAFVSSYIDETAGYYSLDYSTSEVHNADDVALLSLPVTASCAMPDIRLHEGRFVCTSATPGAVCTYNVEPCYTQSSASTVDLDVAAATFVVTAYAEAPGYARSASVSRTFSMAEILGADDTDIRDVNGDGSVTTADIEALAGKLLQR